MPIRRDGTVTMVRTLGKLSQHTVAESLARLVLAPAFGCQVHHIHSNTVMKTRDENNTVKEELHSMVRVNQVSSLASRALLKGLALGSQRERPDIRSWCSVEEQLLDTVNKHMKDQETRPSLLQPVVRTSYGVAGFVLGTIASPDMRDAVIRGLYDSLAETATDQLRTLHKSKGNCGIGVMPSEHETEDVRRLIKTLRDQREDLMPDGHQSMQDSDILFRLFTILTETSTTRELGESPGHDSMVTGAAGVATLAKQITTLLLQLSKKV